MLSFSLWDCVLNTITYNGDEKSPRKYYQIILVMQKVQFYNFNNQIFPLENGTLNFSMFIFTFFYEIKTKWVYECHKYFS